uniref:Structural maintenance of chromosomes protein n=1 Tax=Blastobotrys adeninivorans TaxID=409370 RepID=A0A060T4P0_BLAAD
MARLSQRVSAAPAPRRRGVIDDDDSDADTTVNSVVNESVATDIENIENRPILPPMSPKDTPIKDKSVPHTPRAQMPPNGDMSTPAPVQVAHLEPVTTGRIKQPLADITQRSSNNLNSAISGIEKTMRRVTLNPPSPNGTPVVQLSPRKALFSEPPPAPKQRLVIHKLVLTNFKSYAGRQEIGPFHSSFSAVVGPNGSGKSNVIDSLLFVFGFRASKMRHSKVSSLIHSSSARPDLTFCSVDIHFHDVRDDDEGNTHIVPDSQLVVTRKAFKNNTSKYYINDRDSSFTEVTDLLRNRGIDLDHKRFLILQGEVESISQMKAKAENEHDDGLLEYLEDIIGTSHYKKAIEDSATEVETLNEDCVEKTNRLQLIEKELGSLEGAKNEIVKYLETENEVISKKSALFQLNIRLCTARIELSTKVIEEQQAKLQREIEATSANKEQVEQLTQEYNAKQKELNALSKKAQELSKALSKREIEKVQIEERKKHLDSKRKKLEKTISSAQHSRNESQLWLGSYEEEMAGLKEQISQSEKQLEKEQAVLAQIQDELKDKTQVFTDKIEKAQKKLDPWREKIAAKESEIAVASSHVDMLQERVNAADRAIEDAKAKVEQIRSQGRESENRLEELQKEQEHVNSQIGLGVDECSQATQKLDKMKSKLNAMRQELSSVKEAASSTETQNKVLAGLQKLSNSGRIEGFHGRLGGLGTIDKKFDVAISTACPALDNIVVDTVETGQQCVEYLRKNNLGRAKFILLNKLPKRNLDPIETPEGVPRLFDLVHAREEKFRPAFYSIMFDTLVAKDADQARRIAYGPGKRYRVVTLDGMVIDTSGTMTGGGTTVKSGAMKSKAVRTVSEETLQASEEQLNEYENRVKTAEATLLHMETALQELKDRKPQIELDISKTELEIKSLAKDLQEAAKSYKELVKEGQSDKSEAAAAARELQEAQAVVKKHQSELAKLKEHSHSLEQEIADLQEKIMDAGGVRLRMQKSTVDSLKEKIELASTRLSNGVVEKNKAENEIKKQTRIIDDAEKEIKGSEEDYESLNSEMQTKLEEVQSLESEVEKYTSEVEDRQENLESLKSELDEKKREINKVRSVEIEIKNKIEQHEKTLNEDTNARARYRDQLQALELHDVSELKGLRQSKKDKGSRNDPDEEGEEEDQDMKHSDEDEEMSESADNVGLVEYSADELDSMDKDVLKRDIGRLEESIKDARVDMQVLNDYRRRLNEYHGRRDILNEAVTRRDSTKKQLDDLKQKRLDEFMTGFNAISLKLKEMYQMITMGGNAELELVDSLDPFSEGIIFSVMPPKKSWRNISNLSGGEKTLSSLALVFALHHYKPTPLYVMDEIDAALDFRNVSIVATYIKERTKNGQFIVISLRNNMFELARQLVGIYKVNNMTRSIALENRQIQ